MKVRCYRRRVRSGTEYCGWWEEQRWEGVVGMDPSIDILLLVTKARTELEDTVDSVTDGGADGWFCKDGNIEAGYYIDRNT